MDTWLIYNLTGGANGGAFVTDVSNAARTNLMDIRSCKWHPETCRAFGLETDMLPEIKSNAEVFGHVKDGPLQGDTSMSSTVQSLEFTPQQFPPSPLPLPLCPSPSFTPNVSPGQL